jgi:hypothetical protein
MKTSARDKALKPLGRCDSDPSLVEGRSSILTAGHGASSCCLRISASLRVLDTATAAAFRFAPRRSGRLSSPSERGVSQRKHRTMTFEQILAQARNVRSSLGIDDMAPTALVERMGQLKAIVTLPFDREQALDMIGRARIGFATSAMTIALDSYMRIGPTDLENYERGDMQRAVEASDGKRRGITDALALTHAERIDNETMITFATNAYHWASNTIVWSKPTIIRHTDSEKVAGIWIEALTAAMEGPDVIAAVLEKHPELADDAPP